MAAGDIPVFTDSTHITEATPAQIGAALTPIGTATLGVNSTIQGALKLKGATSGDCTINTPAVAGTATNFTLPNSNGTAQDFLINSGGGVTGWSTSLQKALQVQPGNGNVGLSINNDSVVSVVSNSVQASGEGQLIVRNAVGTNKVVIDGATGDVSATTFTGSGANLTGVPISTGVSGLGSNVATFLATPSSANLRVALTDGTGTGAAVFSSAPTMSSPTLTTPILGTPTSGNLSNCTALNATELTSGTIPEARLRSGMIAQTQYQRRDYTGDISTASSTPSAVTSGGNALEKTITPSSSSSLIRIRIIGGNALALGRMVTLLKRNINGSGDTDITPAGMEGVESMKDQFGCQLPHSIEFTDDTISTILPTVYKVFYYSADNSTTVYWNYGSGGLAPVTMTLEEIVG